jgi:hypothetical protein
MGLTRRSKVKHHVSPSILSPLSSLSSWPTPVIPKHFANRRRVKIGSSRVSKGLGKWSSKPSPGLQKNNSSSWSFDELGSILRLLLQRTVHFAVRTWGMQSWRHFCSFRLKTSVSVRIERISLAINFGSEYRSFRSFCSHQEDCRGRLARAEPVFARLHQRHISQAIGCMCAKTSSRSVATIRN